MKTFLSLPPIQFGVLLCSLLCVSFSSADTSVAKEDVPHTVSVVLLGRKGSGITSTVRQILGSKVLIHSADVAVASTDILEYTLRVPCSKGTNAYNYLKLVDVPGLELGDNLEHDAEILSTLKSYLHDKGLPTFFLVVSRFDDKTFPDTNSNFHQLLKRVEFFQRAVFQATTDNTVFLLTRLLSQPEDVQKAPEARIEEFRKVIQQSTSFPSPIEILVGDNKPNNETVQIEKGFYKFPNNELYPKNILDKLIQLSQTSASTTDEDDKHALEEIFNTLIETRETTEYKVQEIVAHPTDEDILENDLEAFEYLLRQDSEHLNLPTNEIQNILQLSYNKQDATTQINSCVQLLALRVAISKLPNADKICKLPTHLSDQVSFFQQETDGALTSKYGLYYLKNALGLEVPEYSPHDLVVGMGYDIVNDRLLMTTPFLKNPLKRPSSSLGYQFPDFVECEKLAAAEEVALANVTETKDQYHQERLQYLTLPDKDQLVISELKGEPKPYLNMLPMEDSGRLSVEKELRLLECKMTVDNDSVAIVDESFISVVNALPRLNTSCTCSMSQWKLFFHSYGTHIVTKAFGGGSYEGMLWLSETQKPDTVAAKENVDNTLENILNFKSLETDGRVQLYDFHAGGEHDIDPILNRIHLQNNDLLTETVSHWKKQLNAEFFMLDNEIELVSMSKLMKAINADKGEDCEKAAKLLYQGKLETGTGAMKNMKDAVLMRKKARQQALKLRKANADKELQKNNQFNNFVDEASS